MSRQIMFAVLVLLAGILSGCQSQESAEIEQVQQQLAAIESRLDELDQGSDVSGLETQVAALEEKINALEAGSDTEKLVARIEALEEAAGQAEHAAETTSPEVEENSAGPAMPAADDGLQDQRFQVTIATYLLDTAGFHDLDERINQEDTIMPGDAGVVRRAYDTVAATHWPAGLETKANELLNVLEEYAQVLSNDDLEAAKPLAAEAHDVQHDFSQAVERWLAGETDHGDTEHAHDEEAAQVDHSAHQGGLVGMSGDLHLEIVSEKAGEYQVFLSDSFRQPINPEDISGTLVLMPGTDDEVELPLQVMQGEHLAATGGPTGVNAMDVSIRLDGTPEGHVEMDFTLSYKTEPEHEHEEEQKHEHDEEQEHQEEQGG